MTINDIVDCHMSMNRHFVEHSGGASGLGLSMAKQLASRGVSVTILDLHTVSTARNAVMDVAAHGSSVEAATVDATKPAEVAKFLHMSNISHE